MAERAKLIEITIDGQQVQVEEGQTILQAALAHGIEVPHYCYHPGLSIAGNCRMCLLEVEKMPKLAIGCYTPVAEGMVVHTRNERVKEAQAAVQEFLLINHPLDCPICDQAGECRLQEYAVEYGSGKSRYTEPKLALQKAVDIGPHVMLDQERCIQCSRCTRFCDEVTGTSELAFFQRGNRTQIGLYPGKRLDNPYSGNVVDICPVGALTLKESRFLSRVWYLDHTPTVCAGCARGCNVLVGTGRQNLEFTSAGQFDDRIKRVVPRVNEEVNGHWICDEGRLSYRSMYDVGRLRRARAAGAELDHESAVGALAGALGAGRVAAIFSPRLTCEMLYAWRRLLDATGGARLGARRLQRGADDDLLIRADRGANSRGAAWILGDDAGERAVLDAAARGEVDVLLVVGDPLEPDDSPELAGELRGKLKQLVVLSPFDAGLVEQADLALPTATWSEEDGHFVNFEGRIQRVARCHRPRGDSRPGWLLVREVAEAAGVPWPAWSSHQEVFRALGQDVPAFDVDPDDVGLLGVMGAAGVPA